jgi:hypothetical protein
MIAEQLRRLRKGLNLPPSAMDIRKLFPLFAPTSFFATGQWPGPFEMLAASGLGLTWALNIDGGSMRYLDQSMCAHWESQKVDWRAFAFANLRAATTHLFTHELGRKTGGGIFAGAMMHPDGWGPSRLLLRERLAETFPEGYRVAIPEMSCGLAISKRLDQNEEGAVKDIIAKCFQQGTRPLAPAIFEAEQILPKEV